ncbi:glycosyltransferase family 2 protein [Spirosoma montaniterrae]|uniref:Glycosyltransferase n=1 Tax=Spirosoma montaniterrae TaxID=1178516 RepID=A0A1P9X1W4_9BACT|nr:glycosyltransferase family 2 protein [Spirosoma montaniterrae]AQG81585.1 glycosyltransferase [Spirosoma montaniterrae]
MDLPSISVITPSFNQGHFIRQTVESVLCQQYPKLDYTIIDGLSTDNTLSILETYKSQLRLIVEQDSGQTDAINKGLRSAQGEIVCWLNSDDYFLPGTLQAVGTYFAQHPSCLWLTGDCLIVDEEGTIIQQPIRYYKRLLRQLPVPVYLGLTNAVCQPATFWRRSIHAQLGYLDESLRYTMDYDWWLRLKSIQPPVVLARPLTAFRIHKDSKGGSEFSRQFEEDYAVLTKYTSNTLTRTAHRLHNTLINSIYRVLKKV